MIKGIGITAFVFSIISIFLPFYPVFMASSFSVIYLVWLAIVLSGVAAFFGERTFSFAAFLISIVGVFLLNAVLEIFRFFTGSSNNDFALITLVLFAIPIFGFIFGERSHNKKKRLKVGEDPIFK